MGGYTQEHELQNKSKVALAYWEDLKPTEHSDRLKNNTWNQHKGREGLAFYDSTIQYMRNDWAASNMGIGTVNDTNGQKAMLFYSKDTRTWHTADALDIDHATQWKQHGQKLGANSTADWQMAYNDVNNLRLLPSVYNRARDSADDILKTHGPQSQQWGKWVNEHLSFDHTISYREFDPEKDNARRTKTTTGQMWTDENTRSDLRFDKRVMEVWYNKELEKNFVGTANMTNPDGTGTQQVPLFRCAATGQLCTRDAMDIDHAIPLEQVLKKMTELYPNGFTKADALDAYNDVSNLRLVSRSANSSHEWELMPDGHFRDSKIKEIPGEFKNFIKEDGDLKPQERLAVHQAVGEINEFYKQKVRDYFAPPQQPPPQQQPQQNAPLVNQQGHPDNPLFQNVVGKIAQLDPNGQCFKNQDERDRMASSLMVLAKQNGLTGIDKVAWGTGMGQGNIFAEQGDPMLGKFVWLPPQEGISRSVQQNTQALGQIQAPQQQQPQNPNQQHHHIQH
jgi:hypothetical protein